MGSPEPVVCGFLHGLVTVCRALPVRTSEHHLLALDLILPPLVGQGVGLPALRLSIQACVLLTMLLRLNHLRVRGQKLPLHGDLLQLLSQAQLFLALLHLLFLDLHRDLLDALVLVPLLGLLLLLLLTLDGIVPCPRLVPGPVPNLREGLGLLVDLVLLIELLPDLSLPLFFQLLGILGLHDLETLPQLGMRHLLQQTLARLLGSVELLEARHRHLLEGTDLLDEVLSPLHLLLVLAALPLGLCLLLAADLLGPIGSIFGLPLLRQARILSLGLRLFDQFLLVDQVVLEFDLLLVHFNLELSTLVLGQDVILFLLELTGLDGRLASELHLHDAGMHSLLLI
mmetsp:Transcript_39020/g.125416  ORF Transcript_39020/g.125416 Transcript_39020/m.125416 type:complete len:341 (-) Transcript_39020:1266-2288(-)